jgi:hypothetical protein
VAGTGATARKRHRNAASTIYDFLDSSLMSTPRREGKVASTRRRPALDVNTLGEVPDSSGTQTGMHPPDVDCRPQRGPGNSLPPDPSHAWRITAAKSNGITPGFVIEDGRKIDMCWKFDPPLYPEVCSAPDVIGNKIFYALGYNTPKTIVHFAASNSRFADGVLPPSEREEDSPQHMVDELQAAAEVTDGMPMRCQPWLVGEVVGPFDYAAPGVTIRTIRSSSGPSSVAVGCFSAWLNHHDTSQINTMDTLVTEDGRKYLKHYLDRLRFHSRQPW